MVGAVLRLLFAFLFLLPLLSFLVVVVSLALFVLLLVGIAWLLTRRQVLRDVVVVFMLLVFLFVLSRGR